MSKKPCFVPDLPGEWSEFLSSRIFAPAKFLRAHAVARHGSPRYTLGLDLFVEPTLVSATNRLATRAGAHYALVSSTSVYVALPQPADESSAGRLLPDATDVRGRRGARVPPWSS